MSNGEQVQQDIFCDRKLQTTILNMIEQDCTRLYDYYNQNKQQLKVAIEYYEEFITTEINELFERSNSFVEIVLTHGANFKEFIRNINTIDMQYQNWYDKRTEDLYVIYVTVQEWLLQGPKGQQFYSMVDIDAFKFYHQWNPSTNRTVAQTVLSHELRICMATSNSMNREFFFFFLSFLFLSLQTDDNNHSSHVNGLVSQEKIARLSKYGEPAVTLIAFQNNQPTHCDANTINYIRQVQEQLSEYQCVD